MRPRLRSSYILSLCSLKTDQGYTSDVHSKRSYTINHLVTFHSMQFPSKHNGYNMWCFYLQCKFKALNLTYPFFYPFSMLFMKINDEFL